MNLALKAQLLHRHAQMHFRAVIALDGRGGVFGGVLGENRKDACKTFAVSKVIVTLRLTTS